MPDGWIIIFYAATSIFGCHSCDLLTKTTLCMWAVLYLGPAKLTKSTNVFKNCMLGHIHQDHYDPRYMVAQMLGRQSLGLILNSRRVTSKKGETPEEPVWWRNREHPVISCQALGAKHKEAG